MPNILKILALLIIINNDCFSMQNETFSDNVIKNNHNNKYDPNTIYTSTQYLIDNDPILIQDEKKVMQLSKDLCNPNSQNSIVFNFSIKQSINNLLTNSRKSIFMDEFRNIIDTLIKCNIGELPERAEEVKKLNIVLTKVTLNNLLNRVIANNINITEHNILLLNDNNYNITSILGNQFNNDIKDLDNINYKNKQCSFKLKQDCNALYYTVVLR